MFNLKLMNFKTWLRYKYLRLITKSHSYIKYIDSNRVSDLDEIQKPIYDICHKVLHNPKTELRNSRHLYQLESDDYLITIKSTNAPTITLIENSGFCNNIHTVSIDTEYINTIIDGYDREMSRRIKSNESFRIKLMSDHLNRISSKINTRL